MSLLTTDPNDPDIGHGVDETPGLQNKKYLVLSEAERAKGFVRPLRKSYVHVGEQGPKYPLRDLTAEEQERHGGYGYVKYEPYPESESPLVGRFWTQKQLDAVGKGCQSVTTMGDVLAETWARDPQFYGSTYCAHCQMHLEVSQFVWYGTDERLGS